MGKFQIEEVVPLHDINEFHDVSSQNMTFFRLTALDHPCQGINLYTAKNTIMIGLPHGKDVGPRHQRARRGRNDGLPS
jgi:hypothetical protein